MSNENELVHQYVHNVGLNARKAARRLARISSAEKNAALHAIADALIANQKTLVAENERDLANGEKNGLDAAMLDRLTLTPDGIASMADGVRQIAALPDPVGEITDTVFRPSGIQVGKMRVPLGVVGIIFESRPNVTVDAAALCLKSGNASVLRGGSEAIHSNQALGRCIAEGLSAVGLDANVVQIIDTTDRQAVTAMLHAENLIDVIIPRGGKGLVSLVSREAKMPVIKHLDGVCHVYLDAQADEDKAIAVAVNSKTHRYGVCNAMETLLVDKSRAADLLPTLVQAYQEHGVELRGCPLSCEIAGTGINPADESDWAAEYLSPVLAIRIVDGLDDAIEHIETYGSHHTDVIVTENYTTARRFLREVDSSSVMVNASSRFADGGEYGLGAEIGISTDKIHARGPVGLHGLTSQKYIVLGDGHIRG